MERFWAKVDKTDPLVVGFGKAVEIPMVMDKFGKMAPMFRLTDYPGSSPMARFQRVCK